MKQFISFVKKEFYHIFRDWRSLFLLIGIPVTQILILGFTVTDLSMAIYSANHK
jgi:ABC-2 type transport system permease protein